MAKSESAVILDDDEYLKLPDGKLIALDSLEFQDWLSANQSFRFKCGFGGELSYQARKEKAKRGGDYWHGYRRIDGKLRKRYIGKAEEITLPRLKEIAQLLNDSVTEQVTQQQAAKSYPTDYVTQVDKPMLEWNCYAVHRETGEEWFVMGEARSEEKLKNDAVESFSRWDCDPYPGCDIKYRCEPVGSSFKAKLNDCQRNLRRSLETNAKISREKLELEDELKRVSADRDELDREVDRLTEKVGDLDLEKQHLAEELAQARAGLDELRSRETDSIMDELPEASELLNQLKGKFPKSKVSLREVEALLELIDGGGY